ncbi:MAG: nuclear transport factor 2 family protein [Hyphomicrobiaceae bacterium]|nr:nuclear transport factor 2 family protein [Hyphomicrobiaceae bacterium]
MAEGSISVIDRFYEVWFARDVAAILDLMSPVVRMTQHFEDPAVPFAGTGVGKAALEARLDGIFSAWRFLHIEPRHFQSDGVNIRTNCTFEVQHIATGEVFDGTLRHFWVVRDGLITQLDEHLDVARFKAFLRLLGLPSDAT